MKGKATLKAACMAAGMATAWGGATAQADVTLSGSITPDRTITHAYVYYGNNVSDGVLKSLGTLPASQTTVFSQTYRDADFSHGGDWVSDPESYKNIPGPYPRYANYAFIGLYSDNEQNGVILSFPNDDPVTQAASWTDYFGAYPVRQTEPDMVNYLLTDDYWKLDGFLYKCASHSYGNKTGTPYGSPATLVAFTTAQSSGTFIVSVPEPSSILMIGCVTLCLLKRRHRLPYTDDGT